jgi:hypothetical protein
MVGPRAGFRTSWLAAHLLLPLTDPAVPLKATAIIASSSRVPRF